MAKSDKCPICGVAVKPENLIRHLDSIHPRSEEARELREELKRDPARSARPQGAPPLRLRRLHIAIIAIVVVLALTAYYVAPLFTTPSDFVSYCGSEGSAVHYHTLLVINVDGAQRQVPMDIGVSTQETNPAYQCPAGQLKVLHTHDGSGIIHIELPPSLSGTPTLANFFAIWGEPLSSGSVWSFSGAVTAEVVDMGTHQSRDYSSNPGGIPLYAPPNGQDYVSIPQNLIFNGAYGTGQSGGEFSGEVVYLNVTGG